MTSSKTSILQYLYFISGFWAADHKEEKQNKERDRHLLTEINSSRSTCWPK